MNKFPVLFLVIGFGFSILFFWSLEWNIKQAELIRGFALLCSGTILLIYFIKEKGHTSYDYGKKFRGILIGIMCIILGLAQIFSYL